MLSRSLCIELALRRHSPVLLGFYKRIASVLLLMGTNNTVLFFFCLNYQEVGGCVEIPRTLNEDC